MNLELNQKTATDYAITGGSALVGGTVSKGVMGLAPEGFKKPLVRAGICLATLFTAGTIQGKDTGAKIARGALLGVSVEQGMGAVSTLVSPNVKDNPTTKAEKFVAAIGRGMNAPDQPYQPILNLPTSYDWDANQDFQSVNKSEKQIKIKI
ncbi:hypothetical protein [Tenacibaculum aiptasiae]|uniref:hypothetical protein n=1 Tax=Tenacibaculum aiptasiae TaxID=426481 RepID=UPI00232EBDAC|nr:hypothetical protein [Tenacibaculum aiptasiae]